jgi:hypothetical protein
VEIKIILTDQDEIALIKRVALDNKLSVEQYITNIVRGWIEGQLRGKYIDYARKTSLSILKQKLSI